MKLKFNKGQVQNAIPGVEAAVLKNDLTGAVLVIQGGNNIINIKISDIVAHIEAQEAEESKVEKSEA